MTMTSDSGHIKRGSMAKNVTLVYYKDSLKWEKKKKKKKEKMRRNHDCFRGYMQTQLPRKEVHASTQWLAKS